MLQPFHFKQFSILHGNGPFKVGTDGVLLGAWVSLTGRSILDVGTGSGLIALMLAQRLQTANIHAIDINPEAVNLAVQNFQNSMWKDRLSAIHSSLQNFTSDQQFDLIVSNPPFFSGSSKSGNHQKDLARHNDTLSIKELMHHADRLLGPQGSLAVIMPYDLLSDCEALADSYNLYKQQQLTVFGKPTEKPKRVLLQLGKQPTDTHFNLLTIRTANGGYTPEYVRLTQQFYLNLTAAS